MAHFIKFKDKTSQKWFKSRDFDSKEEMLAHYWAKVRAAACDVQFNSPKGAKKEASKTTKEEINMDSSTIVDHIVEGNAVDIEETFNALMDDKLAEAIEAIRPAVYGSVFGSEEESLDELSQQTVVNYLRKNDADRKRPGTRENPQNVKKIEKRLKNYRRGVDKVSGGPVKVKATEEIETTDDVVVESDKDTRYRRRAKMELDKKAKDKKINPADQDAK